MLRLPWKQRIKTEKEAAIKKQTLYKNKKNWNIKAKTKSEHLQATNTWCLKQKGLFVKSVDPSCNKNYQQEKTIYKEVHEHQKRRTYVKIRSENLRKKEVTL